MNNKVFVTKNSEQTQKVGQEFAARLNLVQGSTLTKKGAFVVALYGDLGSGKTTFTQGLAEGLGIKRRIISPTFIIVRNYELGIKNQELGRINLYHIDLYRIESEEDVESLGIEEIVKDPRNVVVIEWAEKL